MPTARYSDKRELFQLRDRLATAIRYDLAVLEKSLLGDDDDDTVMGMKETPGLHQAARHLGLQHVGTHVNRMADEDGFLRSEVHHVFQSPDTNNSVNSLMSHWKSQGMKPTYMGRNSQGFHVVRATDNLRRGTYAHIQQLEHPQSSSPNVNIPNPVRRATVAVTKPVGAPNPLAKLSGAVTHGIRAFKQNLNGTYSDTPRYPGDSGMDIHSLAAAHGIAAYDTRSRWQPNVSGAPGRTAHFSHLMTANNPQAQIQRLHQSIALSHPTTEIKYNRVHVGGVMKHVYSFQHHDGKALHTVTVTKPALERPGGKLQWQ